MVFPHEDPPEQGGSGAEHTDQGDDALGRHWRTHRQRLKTLAPFVCGMLGGSATLTIAFIAPDSAFAEAGWRVAAVLVPLGVLAGLLYNHFAPFGNRVRVAVHEHGVRVLPENGPAVTCVPARVTTVADPGAPVDKQPLALAWPAPGGGTASARLDSFGSARALRRALVDREFSGDPGRSRAVAAAVAAVALVLFYAWLFVPRPLAVPEEYEHLRAFCADPEMVFTDVPAYEGEGPHHLSLVEEQRYLRPVEEVSFPDLGARMEERGWSTDMEDAALIACGRISLGEELDTCSYTPSFSGLPSGHDDRTVPLHLTHFEYDLYEATTHRHVATVEATGSAVEDWECPPRIREDQDAITVEQDYATVVDTLAPYVEDRAEG
ncbi:hypothetical protein [Nocardiopsis halotolerans]|uniref:hypothetical protein n=1 Tax=Nocardiopsis halotolerans TaxID=124252 RepID=UPI0003487CFD|nr:hypothetical protein [Nocardiopsis halotolerans]